MGSRVPRIYASRLDVQGVARLKALLKSSMSRKRHLFVFFAVQLVVILALAWYFFPTASAEGNKSDVIVHKDGSGLQVVPKQCYENGTNLGAVRWIICPKFLQDSDAKNLYLMVSLTENTTGLFPSFTQASVDFNVDGAHFTTGDINWDSETLGRVVHVYTKFVHIPVSRNYLESLTTAHDIVVSVQLTGKSTRKDMHIEGKNLQRFQSGCEALLAYLSAQQ
jgi:hypothetical protein